MSDWNCNTVQDLLPLYVDGVVSEDTALAIKRHIQHCDSCSREYQLLSAELVLPVDDKLQKENLKPLKRLKWKWFLCMIAVIGLSVGLTFAAIAVAQFAENERRNNIKWDHGLFFENLSPGEEVLSEYVIIINDDNASAEYTICWASAGLTLEFGFRDSINGTEYCVERTGGSDFGKLKEIPAGTYYLFVRNSGNYEGIPAFEEPEKFPDVSYSATGGMYYVIH